MQGQPLEILAALIRHPGLVVTRDESQQQLWSGSTFVDHGLNAAMNRLRQALGDSADQPRYIETVTGLGYRFIAPVHDQDAEPVLVMPSAPASELPGPLPGAIQSTASRPWSKWMAAAGVLIGLSAGYLLAVRPPVNPGLPVLRFTVAPPNGYAMEAASSWQTFALSPDGSRLAWTWGIVGDRGSPRMLRFPSARGAELGPALHPSDNCTGSEQLSSLQTMSGQEPP